MGFDYSAIAIVVSLLSLVLALTAMWLVTDFTKRVLAEAKRVIDASTAALWTSFGAHEKHLKVLAKNQEALAGELARTREQIRELETRQRDLLGRIEAQRQDIDLTGARLVSLARMVSPPPPSSPPATPTIEEAHMAAANGSVTLDKLRRTVATGVS
jgi:hypothetical protein